MVILKEKKMSLSDLDKLSDIFKSTMDSNMRESAEKQLEMVGYTFFIKKFNLKIML